MESWALARLAASWASDRVRGRVRFFLDMVLPFAIRATTRGARDLRRLGTNLDEMEGKARGNIFGWDVTGLGGPRINGEPYDDGTLR